MLSACNVDLYLHGGRVLQDISLEVRPAEVLALIGPNGAGKSSLLHVLSGALAPTRGSVTLDGRVLGNWSGTALARRRAVLPQAPALSFPFRVEDVVMLGRSPYAGHAEAAADETIVDHALHATGIAHLAGRLYTTLSGGERQRVQLARVLAQVSFVIGNASPSEPTRYLLLDEPTNNLDIAHQHALMMITSEFADSGHAVCAIVHEPNLAALHADRICVLAKGRVVADGTPAQIMTAELLAEVFGVRTTILQHPVSGRPVMLPA